MLVLDNAHAEFVRSEAGYLLREDVLCWHNWYKGHGFYKSHSLKFDDDASDALVIMLDKLFNLFPEFRSLLDFRLKRVPALQFYKSETFRRASELHINCGSLGPRCRIQHGQNTYIFAKEVGSDFYIHHNVTVGAHNNGIPKIGDRVTVRTGAVVVGPITIGDNAVINANAVVSTDVPPDHVAYAPRTEIKPRKRPGFASLP